MQIVMISKTILLFIIMGLQYQFNRRDYFLDLVRASFNQLGHGFWFSFVSVWIPAFLVGLFMGLVISLICIRYGQAAAEGRKTQWVWMALFAWQLSTQFVYLLHPLNIGILTTWLGALITLIIGYRMITVFHVRGGAHTKFGHLFSAYAPGYEPNPEPLDCALKSDAQS